MCRHGSLHKAVCGLARSLSISPPVVPKRVILPPTPQLFLLLTSRLLLVNNPPPPFFNVTGQTSHINCGAGGSPLPPLPRPLDGHLHLPPMGEGGPDLLIIAVTPGWSVVHTLLALGSVIVPFGRCPVMNVQSPPYGHRATVLSQHIPFGYALIFGRASKRLPPSVRMLLTEHLPLNFTRRGSIIA
jgi:hypothetical protein